MNENKIIIEVEYEDGTTKFLEESEVDFTFKDYKPISVNGWVQSKRVISISSLGMTWYVSHSLMLPSTPGLASEYSKMFYEVTRMVEAFRYGSAFTD